MESFVPSCFSGSTHSPYQIDGYKMATKLGLGSPESLEKPAIGAANLKIAA
jgi:hypothetical protein